MAKVVVRFFDDETLEGVARDLDFDEPDFLVEALDLRFAPEIGRFAEKGKDLGRILTDQHVFLESGQRFFEALLPERRCVGQRPNLGQPPRHV